MKTIREKQRELDILLKDKYLSLYEHIIPLFNDDNFEDIKRYKSYKKADNFTNIIMSAEEQNDALHDFPIDEQEVIKEKETTITLEYGILRNIADKIIGEAEDKEKLKGYCIDSKKNVENLIF